MMPDNSLSLRTVQARFLFPDGINFSSPYQDYEMGGIALQDPSKGLDYWVWYGYWEANDSTVYIQSNLVSLPVPLFTEPDVFEFSFAFDQNMRYVTGVLKTDGTFQLRWYDTLVGGYSITNFTGIEGFKLTHDDKRAEQIQAGVTDVIFTYIRSNALYFRMQRERYQVEHLLADDLPNNLMVANFGMNERFRLQWRLRYRNPGEQLPWLL